MIVSPSLNSVVYVLSLILPPFVSHTMVPYGITFITNTGCPLLDETSTVYVALSSATILPIAALNLSIS